ncbi:putative ribonuclease h protein [Quercus suber]|uniref:Ribonuclease h protein n=1 Tax=Quercus suber TaxID=58331 RepID=A0AAW0M989_QUESU|nr:putative ribonuclease h protein [Quercus suber]
MLRDCPFVAAFWKKIGVPIDLNSTFNLDIHKWLEANCVCNPLIKVKGYRWRKVFTFAIWSLWKHRNKVVFEDTTLNPNLHDSCLKQVIEYVYCVGKSFRTKQVRGFRVKWNKPLEGWCKLNSDRAPLGNPGRARGGGLIRDHRGA